ncbi:MAG TPA: twin-arginine translocation signal domain-containing protein [Spirochaetes bacterium]|nr:twin-arginine translocation signal domain-containing protein [Spirochaetota bacterium]
MSKKEKKLTRREFLKTGAKTTAVAGAVLAGGALMKPGRIFAGAEKATPGAEEKGNIIKVGLNVPLSGPVAYWGVCIDQAYRMAADHINTDGGVKIGDETYMIEIIVYDTKNTVPDARAGATRMIHVDKVKYVVTQAAATMIGTEDVTNPNKVVLQAACWGYRERISSDYFYSFRSEMSDLESGYASYPWMIENYPKIKTSAFIGPDDEDGYSCYEAHQWLCRDHGLKDVGKVYFAWETLDFYPIVTKALAMKPDMLDMSPVPPGITADMVKAAREMGFTGPIHSPAALETRTILEVAGEYATDVVLPVTMEEPQTDLQAYVMDEAKARYGVFNALAGNYYHWLFSLKQAWETAGTVEDTHAVAEALGNSRLENSFLGTVIYAGEEIYGVKRQSIYHCPITLLKDGAAKLVDFRFPKLPSGY